MLEWEDLDNPATRMYTILCVTAAFVLYLHFFFGHRLVALILQTIARKYIGDSAHIAFNGWSFSLIGCQMRFHNVEYITKNISVCATSMEISFRWWKLREIQEGSLQQHSIIFIEFYGLEFAIFNNSSKYDELYRALGLPVDTPAPTPVETESVVSSSEPLIEDLSLSRFYKNFPSIGLKARYGAIKVGNPLYKRMMVWSFRSAEGDYHVEERVTTTTSCRSGLTLTFAKTKISFEVIKSDSFPQRAAFVSVPAAVRIGESSASLPILTDVFHRPWAEQFSRDHDPLEAGQIPLVDFDESSQSSNSERDDITPPQPVIEAPSLIFEYYWDTPRLIREPEKMPPPRDAPKQGIRIDFGRDSKISYGPWEDANRYEIQKLFLPYYYQPATIYTPVYGQPHPYPSFDVSITFGADCEVAVPFYTATKELKKLSISASDGSTISFKQPWILFRPEDNTGILDVCIRSTEICLPNNGSVFITSNEFKIMGFMKNALVWNKHHRWEFEIIFSSCKWFLLYDHIAHFQDLVAAWSGSSKPEMETFVPYSYTISLVLKDFSIVLNANESNVIDHPSIPEKNVHYNCFGDSMNIALGMDFTQFMASRSHIPFNIQISNLQVDVTFPNSHAFSKYLQGSDRNFLKAGKVLISGFYAYYYQVESANVDMTKMNIDFEDATFTLNGCYIRHFFFLQDNYSGASTKSQTLQQYKEALNQPRVVVPKPPSNKSETYVVLKLRKSKFRLPSHLYNHNQHAIFAFDMMSLDSRSYDSSLDLLVEFSRSVLSFPNLQDRIQLSKLQEKFDVARQFEISLKGITVHRNTIYGLVDDAKVSTNYNIKIGNVLGNLVSDHIDWLSSWQQQFFYHLEDADHAFKMDPPPMPVLDTLRLKVASILLNIWGSESVSEIRLENGMEMISDSFVNPSYKYKSTMHIPSIEIIGMKALLIPDAAICESSTPFMKEVLFSRMSLVSTTIEESSNWVEESKRQLEFLKRQCSNFTSRMFCHQEQGVEEDCQSWSDFDPDEQNEKSDHLRQLGSLASPASGINHVTLGSNPRNRGSFSSIHGTTPNSSYFAGPFYDAPDDLDQPVEQIEFAGNDSTESTFFTADDDSSNEDGDANSEMSDLAAVDDAPVISSIPSLGSASMLNKAAPQKVPQFVSPRKFVEGSRFSLPSGSRDWSEVFVKEVDNQLQIRRRYESCYTTLCSASTPKTTTLNHFTAPIFINCLQEYEKVVCDLLDVTFPKLQSVDSILDFVQKTFLQKFGPWKKIYSVEQTMMIIPRFSCSLAQNVADSHLLQAYDQVVSTIDVNGIQFSSTTHTKPHLQRNAGQTPVVPGRQRGVSNGFDRGNSALIPTVQSQKTITQVKLERFSASCDFGNLEPLSEIYDPFGDPKIELLIEDLTFVASASEDDDIQRTINSISVGNIDCYGVPSTPSILRNCLAGWIKPFMSISDRLTLLQVRQQKKMKAVITKIIRFHHELTVGRSGNRATISNPVQGAPFIAGGIAGAEKLEPYQMFIEMFDGTIRPNWALLAELRHRYVSLSASHVTKISDSLIKAGKSFSKKMPSLKGKDNYYVAHQYTSSSRQIIDVLHNLLFLQKSRRHSNDDYRLRIQTMKIRIQDIFQETSYTNITTDRNSITLTEINMSLQTKKLLSHAEQSSWVEKSISWSSINKILGSFTPNGAHFLSDLLMTAQSELQHLKTENTEQESRLQTRKKTTSRVDKSDTNSSIAGHKHVASISDIELMMKEDQDTAAVALLQVRQTMALFQTTSPESKSCRHLEQTAQISAASILYEHRLAQDDLPSLLLKIDGPKAHILSLRNFSTLSAKEQQVTKVVFSVKELFALTPDGMKTISTIQKFYNNFATQYQTNEGKVTKYYSNQGRTGSLSESTSQAKHEFGSVVELSGCLEQIYVCTHPQLAKIKYYSTLTTIDGSLKNMEDIHLGIRIKAHNLGPYEEMRQSQTHATQATSLPKLYLVIQKRVREVHGFLFIDRMSNTLSADLVSEILELQTKFNASMADGAVDYLSKRKSVEAKALQEAIEPPPADDPIAYAFTCTISGFQVIIENPVASMLIRSGPIKANFSGMLYDLPTVWRLDASRLLFALGPSAQEWNHQDRAFAEEVSIAPDYNLLQSWAVMMSSINITSLSTDAVEKVMGRAYAFSFDISNTIMRVYPWLLSRISRVADFYTTEYYRLEQAIKQNEAKSQSFSKMGSVLKDIRIPKPSTLERAIICRIIAKKILFQMAMTHPDETCLTIEANGLELDAIFKAMHSWRVTGKLVELKTHVVDQNMNFINTIYTGVKRIHIVHEVDDTRAKVLLDGLKGSLNSEILSHLQQFSNFFAPSEKPPPTENSGQNEAQKHAQVPSAYRIMWQIEVSSGLLGMHSLSPQPPNAFHPKEDIVLERKSSMLGYTSELAGQTTWLIDIPVPKLKIEGRLSWDPMSATTKSRTHVAIDKINMELSPALVCLMEEFGYVSERISSKPSPAETNLQNGTQPVIQKPSGDISVTIISLKGAEIKLNCSGITPIMLKLTIKGMEYMSSSSPYMDTLHSNQSFTLAHISLQMVDDSLASKAQECFSCALHGLKFDDGKIHGLRPGSDLCVNSAFTVIEAATVNINLAYLENYIIFSKIWSKDMLRSIGFVLPTRVKPNLRGKQDIKSQPLFISRPLVCLFANFYLDQAVLTIDFAQSIYSKLTMNWSALHLRFGDQQDGEVNSKHNEHGHIYGTFHTRECRLDCEGELSATGSIEELSAQVLLEESKKHDGYLLARVTALLYPYEFQVKYNVGELIEIKGGNILFQTHDSLRAQQDALLTISKAFIYLNDLNVLLSYEFFQIVDKITAKISNFYTQYENMANDRLARRVGIDLSVKAWGSNGEEEISPSEPFLEIIDNEVPTGRFVISSSNVNINFFQYSIRDLDWARLIIQQTEYRLSQRVDGNKKPHRVLELLGRNHTIYKITSKKSSKEGKKSGKSSEKGVSKIFDIPDYEMKMETHQDDNTVCYDFASNFQNPIFASLDFNQYQYLQKVFGNYLSSEETPTKATEEVHSFIADPYDCKS
eukprot:TRINITY_DN8093_c0_g1_i1.p1 TRINITY_DN8093_c0_g1~~TRINITY_DN8093_c0_g1_i1.p1  ORF type:complete len:3038 (-),score=525.83 TRINITY_DN8093_c0_g1_i1:555-9668(-)